MGKKLLGTDEISLAALMQNEKPKSLSELAEEYFETADKLQARIDEIKRLIASRPTANELNSLRRRRAMLMEERRDLICTACELTRLAAPKTPSPSLSKSRRRWS